MKYGKTDGWLFYCTMGKSSVYNLISTGDYLNRAIFNYDDLDCGLNRLIVNGLVLKKRNSFYRTRKGKEFYKLNKPKGLNLITEMLYFQELFADLEMEEAPNLMRNIVSRYDYDLAIDKINGNTKKYLLKMRLKSVTKEQKEILKKLAESATYAKGNLEVHNTIIEYEEYYGAMAYNVLHRSVKALIPKYNMLNDKDYKLFEELIIKYPSDNNLKTFLDILREVDKVLINLLTIEGVAL